MAESDEQEAFCSDFGLRASFGIRHSDFVIVQSLGFNDFMNDLHNTIRPPTTHNLTTDNDN